MDIIELIKRRRTIRKYQNKPIARKLVRKIIQAGRLAPSPENFQPWRFIVLAKKNKKKALVEYLKNYPAKNFLTPVNMLIKNSLKVIENAPVVIFVYNTQPFLNRAKRLGKKYQWPAYISEIESIGAAIENMFLVANWLNIGMCWLGFPLLIRNRINKFLATKEELVAVIALGYPAEKVKRLKRKPIKQIVNWL